jgi:uncharacterized protein YifN (PemK superfamily)
MPISYRPKVGEVLICNFGRFELDLNGDPVLNNFNGRIPNEMIKQRMVVVLNGKLGGGCFVVPISSTLHTSSLSRGWHTPLGPENFKVTPSFAACDRWAKADAAQMVSSKRLFKLNDGTRNFDQYLSREAVAEIQKSVVKVVSAGSLLK